MALETVRPRVRLAGRLLVFAAGLGAVGVGAFNLFLAPLSGFEAVTTHRVLGAVVTQGSAYYLGDAVLVLAGLAAVYLAAR